MKNIFNFFKRKKEYKPLEALQIEISSICNLKCNFCPTTYLNHKGENRLMSYEVFQRLEPVFSWAQWVYLQGWGEPLLNADIWKMVKLIKKYNSKIGFTTNGTLLGEKTVKKILENQINLISVSIAGSSAATHESLRVKSNFLEILNNIERLIYYKKKSNSSYPIISVSYMLTKRNIKELLEAVRMLYELGVDDFYTTNLDYCFSEEANKEKVFVWEETPVDEYKKYITEAESFARKNNFSFRTYPISLQEQLAACDLNPSRFVFITANGDVTPCTYLGRMENPRYFKDEYVNYPRKVFGNIIKDDFEVIWNYKEYKEFRNIFVKRIKAYQELIESYTYNEPSLVKIKEAERKCSEVFKDNPLPLVCQSCPKAYGI